MRLAAIDVGTNTALLLVADVRREGQLTVLHEAERVIRLGEDVDETGTICDAAMARLGQVLLTYRELIERHHTREVVVVGTSAARDAQNQQEVVDFVARETGYTFEVLSGAEEARWSFAGAVSAYADRDAACAVLDIGGGSTEVILGHPDQPPETAHSLDVGSVRLTERFLDEQPAAPDAIARAEDAITQALDETPLTLDAATPLIGTGGTPICLALVEGFTMDEIRSGTVRLPAARVQAWRERLFTMPYEEVFDLDPRIMEGRADVFPAAVLILDTLLQRFDLPACHVSPRGLRHGLVLRHAREQF
ncbi:MAG: exopolyphosphatase, partial [Bacteroidetes bacterium]|nr:exopolyphosphatase [Bacteroidota bacterium]